MRHVVLLLGVLAAGVDAGSPAWAQSAAKPPWQEVREVELPDLASVDAAVRQSIEERAEAVRGIERATVAQDQAAALYGALGQVLHAHEFRDAAGVCYDNARVLDGSAARWPYLLGVLALEESRFTDARHHFERSRALDARYLPTLVRLGNTALKTLELETARSVFSEGLREAPESAAIWCGWGRLLSVEGRYADAVAALERCLELDPSAKRYHSVLASAYRKLGRDQQAREHAARYGPGDVSFSDPWLRELQGAAVNEDRLLSQANRALLREDYDSALVLYRRAIAEQPTDARARQGLATLSERTGDLDEAAVQYREILTSRPDDVLAHFNLASVEARLGRYPSAIEHYRAVVRLDPGDREARANLAWLLERAGELEEALALRAELADRSDASGEARLDHARLLVRLGRIEEAQQALAGHLEQQPGDVAAHLLRASAHMIAGQCEAAREALRSSMRAVSEPRSIRLALARSFFQCADPAGRDPARGLAIAQELFEEAQTPDVAETLAEGHATSGNYAEALRWQRIVVEQAEGRVPGKVIERLKAALARYEARASGQAHSGEEPRSRPPP